MSDKSLVNTVQYQKWINLCGTYDDKIIESVTIGKNHFEEKCFKFKCDINPGIPGKKARNIDITLSLDEKN